MGTVIQSPLCNSVPVQQQCGCGGGLDLSPAGGNGLLKLVKAISPPPSSPALGQRTQGWVAQGFPLSLDWSRVGL